MHTKLLFKTTSLVLLIAFLLGSLLYIRNNPTPRVEAAGDLAIDWGVPSGDPIFVVANMLPGDSESRSITVTNNASVSRPVAVRGEKTSETLNMSHVVDFTISDGATDLYGGTSATGPKTLANFFTDTALPDSIPLSTLSSGQSKTYTFKTHFQESAGNEYQTASVVFNLIIGVDSDIPAECSAIEFSGPAIFGTQNSDFIQGTRGNDLIFALEGDDRVMAFGGDDCIIGGTGNDELRGETNDDIIFGNEGNDLVVGAAGRDLLFGGDGNDDIRGENGVDYIEGGSGDDYITGGNSEDEIYSQIGNDQVYGENADDFIRGGEGNDLLDGGNGSDDIDGENGNDTLHGKSGPDTLVGSIGTDTANGWAGSDTCTAETEVSCEL